MCNRVAVSSGQEETERRIRFVSVGVANCYGVNHNQNKNGFESLEFKAVCACFERLPALL
jgi:hypothetical protein